jgi:hypothetical protein
MGVLPCSRIATLIMVNTAGHNIELLSTQKTLKTIATMGAHYSFTHSIEHQKLCSLKSIEVFKGVYLKFDG